MSILKNVYIIPNMGKMQKADFDWPLGYETTKRW